MKTVRKALVSLGMSVVLVFAAGALSWAYYSEGVGHYVALTVAAPFVVASKVVSSGNAAIALAFVIYFAFCFGLVSLVSLAVELWRRR